MVVMPVKLYNSTTDNKRETAMSNLHIACGTPVKMPKHCPTCNIDVAVTDMVKGYAIGKDQYVRLTKEELATLPLSSTGNISVDGFIKDGLDDPRWVEKTYFLTPDKVGGKAFALFLKAMAAENVSGVAKITMREGSGESLCIVKPWNGLLTLQTLRWPEELKETQEFMPDNVAITDREMAMAKALINSMTGEFTPYNYVDSYTEAFKKLVEAKLSGEVIAAPVPLKDTSTDDIMAALEASLAAMGAKAG
jgi:DNA end-binding protein Ku